MLKPLVAIGAFAIVGGVAWLALPQHAVAGIAQAIETGDEAALERHVDVPRLRENLKRQVGGMFDLEEAPADGPLGALARGFARRLTDGVLDALLTPSGIADLLRGADLANARYAPASHERVSAFVTDRSGDEIELVLAREGLRWKLVDIVIPASGHEG